MGDWFDEAADAVHAYNEAREAYERIIALPAFPIPNGMTKQPHALMLATGEHAARTALPRALACVEAADALVRAGYQHYICKGAWEPLQEGETWDGKAKCCPLCAAFAGYQKARRGE